MMDKKSLKLTKPIALCGFMGSGKSGLGKIISSSIDIPFYDLDKIIEVKYDATISQLFSSYGENWFRATERKELLDFLASSQQKKTAYVLSLGGGSLQTEEIVATINELCELWFIEVSFDQLIERIMQRTTRPLLLDKEGKMKPKNVLYDELKALYCKRLPIYQLANNLFKSNQCYTKEENAKHLLTSILSKH
jgi:shikimate kinase